MRKKSKAIQTAAFGVPEHEMKAMATYCLTVSPAHMSRLRLLKLESGKPITALVADALDYFFDKAVDA